MLHLVLFHIPKQKFSKACKEHYYFVSENQD